MPYVWPIYLSLFGISFLIIWMLADASFLSAVELLLIQLGLKSDLGMGIRWSMPKVALSLRLVALVLLVTFILASYAIGFWKAFTYKQGTDLKGLFLIVFVSCVALFVLLRFETIAWIGYRLRCLYRSEEITAECKMILENWPVKDKLVSSLGSLNPPDDNPDVTTIDESLREEYTFRDAFGPLIFRQDKRLILDSKTYPLWKLEYSAAGQIPTAYIVDYGRMIVRYEPIEIRMISSRLYLCRYHDTRIR